MTEKKSAEETAKTKNLVLIEFDGQYAKIDSDELNDESFQIDFGGRMILFQKNEGAFFPTNGVDGYGNNLRKEIAGKDVKIYVAQEYVSQVRTALTPEEEQAMDEIAWPLVHASDSSGGDASDANGDIILEIFSSDRFGKLIVRLLNEANERRKG